MLFVLILSGGKQTSTFKPFKLRLEFKIEQRTEVGIYKGRLHLIILCYLIVSPLNTEWTSPLMKSIRTFPSVRNEKREVCSW